MDGMGMLVMIVPFIAIFYFLMIRPEQKRKKKAAEMRDSLAVGDEVTTIGGIVGKVVQVKDDFITIETSEDRVRIRITKWAIGTKGKSAEELPPGEQAQK